MSMLLPTLRTSEPPKSTKKYSVPEVKTAKIGKSYGREKPNGTNYVYVSYGLERQNPQTAPKGILLQR